MAKRTADETVSKNRAAKRLRKTESKPQARGQAEAKNFQTPALSSVLRDEERSFPRGGASILTPLEHKRIQIDATRDVLFEQSGNKRLSRGTDSDYEVEGALGEVEAKGKKKRKIKEARKKEVKESQGPQVKIEGLSPKRLAEGSIVLGQVIQITSTDVRLSLPNNLSGLIHFKDVSDQLNNRLEKQLSKGESNQGGSEDEDDNDDVELKDLFSIGQYLRAYVKSVDDNGLTKTKTKIDLLTEPRYANHGLSKSGLVPNTTVQASVVSVEDHGLVMDLGLDDSSLKGFIPSEKVGSNINYSKLQQGAVLLCMVTGLSPNGCIVQLSADPQEIGNIRKSHFLSEAPTIDSFLPGTAVEFLLSEVSSNGVIGQIMGMLVVTADLFHSGGTCTHYDITKKYKAGTKTKARIICTFPQVEPRKLGVSLLDHVVGFTRCKPKGKTETKDPLEVLPLSSVVDMAKIVKVESTRGLFMDLGVEGIPGFAHISRIQESRIDILPQDTGAYKVGSIHRTRIIGYNPMDGIFLLSLEQKVLDQPFLRYEDVKVGQVVKGRVEKLFITPKGRTSLFVQLAEGINGMAEEIHLADVNLQHPERKFRDGVSVTARVLSTDPEQRRIRLTLKKSLVNSDQDVWDNYSKIVPGSRSPGTLVKVLEKGAIVYFYSNVRAYLPVGEMSEAFIRDAREHFREGQVVNVHALTVNPATEEMTVSCRDHSVDGVDKIQAFQALRIGSLVEGVVSEKAEDLITVELKESQIKGIIRLGHLSDGSEKKNRSSMKMIRVGQALENLLILEKLEKRTAAILSLKPSLIKAAKENNLPIRFEDVQENRKIPGFVRNITTEAVFVQFANGLVSLLLKSQLTPEMLKLPDFGLRRDGSITVDVLSINYSQRRFLVTMRGVPTSRNDDGTTNEGTATSLVHSVDPKLISVADFEFGRVTKATIVSVKNTQLNVKLADNLQGRVDISEAFNNWNDIEDKKAPLKQFKPRQEITVMVLGLHDARTHRFLPISHRTSKIVVLELSIKATSRRNGTYQPLGLDQIQEGSQYLGFVNNLTENCAWVNLSPNVRGRVDLIELSDDLSALNSISESFPKGCALRLKVKSVDSNSGRLDLYATSSPTKSLTLASIQQGEFYTGRITKVTERDLMVQLSDSISGRVHITELTDDYEQANPTTHQKHEIVRVQVLNIDIPNKKVELTMRPSKVLSSTLPVKDPQVSSYSQLKVNQVVRGFINNVADKGLFVSLSPTVKGFVHVGNLSDSFIKDWKSAFELDQLVRGKIVELDAPSNRVRLSLKQTVLNNHYVPPLTYNDLQVGQVVTGKIRKVEDFGVFIVVDNSNNVSGLCHKSEIADGNTVVKKLYEEGDVVKAIVLKIDLERRRVNFGLKASYLKNMSNAQQHSDSDSEDALDITLVNNGGSNEEGISDGDLAEMRSISELGEDSVLVSQMDVDEPDPVKQPSGLTVSHFDWDGAATGESERTEADSENDQDSCSRKKRRRKSEIKVDRTGDLDALGPQSVDDFERLLHAEPLSAELWVKYMAFQLNLNEVGEARKIGDRALKMFKELLFRDEEGKLDVWTALLNLELHFGNEEKVEEVFKHACQENDSEEVQRRLVKSYIDMGKYAKADSLFQSMTKQKAFTFDLAFWNNYAAFLMTTMNEPARARALLGRAMQSVPEKSHRQLSIDFAALEFKSPNGDPERGRTLFEGLISTWPRRLDIWDVFVELERRRLLKLQNEVSDEVIAQESRKQNNKSEEITDQEQNVRQLYERMASARMKLKRAQFVFKRWLDFEEGIGGKGRERVKALRHNWVETAGNVEGRGESME